MNLNYKTYGEGKPLIILHGLFGSLDNWVTLAKRFGEHYQVFIVDQRNHGQSPHSDDMNYTLMADDLIDFIATNNITNPTVLGHSMGGKTAMMAALKAPNAIEQIISVDMAPKAYPVHHRQILDGLLSLNFDELNSRRAADEQLAAYIPEMGVRQFLLKNLYWIEKDKLQLRFNLHALNEHIEQLGTWDPPLGKFSGDTLFIRGGKSDYLDEEDLSIHESFTNASLVTVENAGHWVHAEAPEELFRLVTEFI